MGETLRFGIIGAGVIGQVHARAITGLPEARLVAVTDSVPEKADYLPAFPEADSHDPSCYRQEHPLRASFFFLLGNQTGMNYVSARAPPDEEGERAFLALAIFRSRKKTDISLRRQRANARSRWQHFGR